MLSAIDRNSLSAFKWNACPPSPEYPPNAQSLEDHSVDRARGWRPSAKEYFLAAIPDQFAAMAALRKRRDMSANVELIVIGEATPDYFDWLDIRSGTILCVLAVS